MNKNDIQNSADMFLYKSTIDLNSAKYLLEAYNEEKIEIDIEKIYFELQQSTEKLLKSLLCRKAVSFPKTHDIEQLLNLCEEHNITLPENSDKLIELSDYAVEGRYSIIHDDLNEADIYIKLIQEIY
jgi:HEPN domain-containing protein